jgi:acyl-homoserine-lactone acylase
VDVADGPQDSPRGKREHDGSYRKPLIVKAAKITVRNGEKTSMKKLLVVAGLAICLGQTSSAQTQKLPHGEIVWDTYGTPHIFAKNTVGLYYGFGYAQAKGHGDLLLHLYAESRGRAAEYWGTKYAASDRYIAANDVWPRVEEWYKKQTPAMKADLEAFAAASTTSANNIRKS